MRKQLVAFAIIGIFFLTVFSGCTEQQKTNTDTDNDGEIGLKETFSMDSTEGHFSLLGDSVEINVNSGSVSEPVNVTVEVIQNPVDDPSLYLFSCYEFGPDGLTFNRPIDVIIHYNIDDIPAGVEESSIQVYVLNGQTWEPMKDSFANVAMHYAVAKVSHFSKMAGGGPAPASEGTDDGGNDDESDDDANSSQYWFKANLNFYNHKTPRSTDWDDDDTYSYGVSAYWDPVPYVQYYQIKFDFQNNPPTTAYAWGCDYRKQGKPWCSLKTPYNKLQGYIYHLAGDPTLEGYLTLYNISTATMSKVNEETGELEHTTYGRMFPEGKHGFAFFGVYDTVDDEEGLTDYEIGVLGSQMEGFVQSYVANWAIWVRGVTESGS